ncbi:hypothetical protein V8F06_000410 [Rhypophila decipiens]
MCYAGYIELFKKCWCKKRPARCYITKMRMAYELARPGTTLGHLTQWYCDEPAMSTKLDSNYFPTVEVDERCPEHAIEKRDEKIAQKKAAKRTMTQPRPLRKTPRRRPRRTPRRKLLDRARDRSLNSRQMVRVRDRFRDMVSSRQMVRPEVATEVDIVVHRARDTKRDRMRTWQEPQGKWQEQQELRRTEVPPLTGGGGYMSQMLLGGSVVFFLNLDVLSFCPGITSLSLLSCQISLGRSFWVLVLRRLFPLRNNVGRKLFINIPRSDGSVLSSCDGFFLHNTSYICCLVIGNSRCAFSLPLWGYDCHHSYA